MIIDTLDNLSKYAPMNPLFGKVAEYIKNIDLAAQQPGKVEIEGKDLFANFCVSKSKTPDVAKLETHNMMIDIQIPISCPETMGYTPRQELQEAEYNAEKDITFYQGPAKEYVTIYPGSFVIFFPEDGHAPCIAKEEEIQKVIFKVKN